MKIKIEKKFKKSCQILLFFTFIICSIFTGVKAKSENNLILNVQENGWGEGRTKDRVKVFKSAANQILKHFKHQPRLRIKIVPSDKNPRLFDKKTPEGEYWMRLTADDRRWAKYSYQFSHELCHVLMPGSSLDKKNNNYWFEEALCDLSSFFVLRGMSKEWTLSPPYENWKEYAPSLKEYSSDELNKSSRKLPDDLSVAEWYEKNKAELSGDKRVTELVELAAKQMLPIFEEHPNLWESLNYFSFGSEKNLGEILNNWRRNSPPHAKLAIKKIIYLFGFRTYD